MSKLIKTRVAWMLESGGYTLQESSVKKTFERLLSKTSEVELHAGCIFFLNDVKYRIIDVSTALMQFPNEEQYTFLITYMVKPDESDELPDWMK